MSAAHAGCEEIRDMSYYRCLGRAIVSEEGTLPADVRRHVS